MYIMITNPNRSPIISMKKEIINMEIVELVELETAEDTIVVEEVGVVEENGEGMMGQWTTEMNRILARQI